MGTADGLSGANTLRTFVAIELPPAVISEVHEVQGDMRHRLGEAMSESHIRWTNPDGIHLTLRFLGATNPAQLGDIHSRIEHALSGHHRLDLSLGAPGVFPRSGLPRVVWIGLNGDLDALISLQSAIEVAIVSLGFQPESRPFTPHLTLARLGDRVGGGSRAAILDAISSRVWSNGASFAVERVSLMRSELGRGGARYSRIWAVDLE